MVTNVRLLYHGTTDLFMQIDLSLARGYKEFGCGFYMSDVFDHAKTMAITRMETKKRRGEIACAYVYKCDVPATFKNIQGINYKEFKAPTVEWLDFILRCRKNRRTVHKYDVVYGPTADASTVAEIDKYYDGMYGKVGTYETKKALIRALKTHVYPYQTCVCTPKAVNYIKLYEPWKVG